MKSAAYARLRELQAFIRSSKQIDPENAELLQDLQLDLLFVAIKEEPLNFNKGFVKLCEILSQQNDLIFACMIFYETPVEPGDSPKLGFPKRFPEKSPKPSFEYPELLQFTSTVREYSQVQLDPASPFNFSEKAGNQSQ